MQSDEKTLIFRYKDQTISRKLSVDQNINKLTAFAKSLFSCPNEDQYYLALNDQELNEDTVLGDLNIIDLTVDLVQKGPANDLVSSQILDATNLPKCQDSVSKSFGEVLDKSFSSSCFEFSAEPENSFLQDIQDIKSGDLTLKLAQKSANQEAKKDEEEKTEEKEICFFFDENKIFTLSLDWSGKVSSLKPVLSDTASLPAETFQMWSVNGKELDDDKSLASQLTADNLKIQVQLLSIVNLKINSKEKQFVKQIPMYPNYSIQELKIKLEKEIQIISSNQYWHLYGSKDGLSNDAKLRDFVQNPEDGSFTIFIKDQSLEMNAQSKEKKIYRFQYQGKNIRKQLFIAENIGAMSQTILKAFKFPDDISLILKFKGETLDFNKCLNDYVLDPTEPIMVEILQIQEERMKILLCYQNQDFEFFVKEDTSIQEMKEKICLELNIQPSYLYSISLDGVILHSSELLQNIPDFVEEESVLTLSTELKISLILDQKNVAEIDFDSSLKIGELQRRIKKEKQVRSPQEFYLKFGEIKLEESNSLSFYLKNEDPVMITICKPEKQETKVNLLFNKLPENKKYSISALRSERYPDLMEKISQEFGILSSNQVWKHKEDVITGQPAWEESISRYDEKEDLLIDIFECPKPFNRKIDIIRHQYGITANENLELNLVSSVRKLKKLVAQKLELSDAWSQTWKVESKELQDDLPLALYENSIRKESLHIYFVNQAEITLLVEGKTLKVFLDVEAPIQLLKETLFRESKVAISPEMQLWSLEVDNAQVFEDNEKLNFYLEKTHRNEIWVKKRVILFKILLNDIEANSKKELDVEIDPTSSVGALKEKLKMTLNIDPSQQYWTDGQIEFKNECSLNDYLGQEKNAFAQVEILKLKEFLLILDEKDRFSLQAPLNLKVSDFKKKVQKHLQGIEAERILLESYNKRLEDTQELQSYFHVWIHHDRPVIAIKKKAMLKVHFLEKVEKFYFGDETTALILQKEVNQRFSLGDHKHILWDEKKEVLERDLKEILKNNSDKVLSCQKVKEFSMTFEDLKDDAKKVVSVDAMKPISLFVTKAAEKLQVSIDECIVTYKEQQIVLNQAILLDHLDPESPLIELMIQTKKILEVKKQGQIFNVSYLPSETIENVKKKLALEGFSEIEKFSFLYNNTLLKDEQTFDSLKIKYGKHVLTAVPNKKISTTIKGEEILQTCGGDLKYVGDLKLQIQASYKIEKEKQLLILINKDQWQRILNQDDEILQEIQTDNHDKITILCKTKKIFSIKLGNQKDSEIFEGLANTYLEEQKRFFELIYKIPANQQVWVTEKKDNLVPVDGEEFFRNLADDYYNNHSIQIFRKINLSICLTENSHLLKDIPTYETVRAQKEKMNDLVSILPQNQSWFYDDKELADDDLLEEYFATQKDTHQTNPNYALDLIVLEDLEYFGFTEKNQINIDLFQKFFQESDEDLDLIIKSVHFNKKEDSLQFRNKLLGLFFGTLKKHSLWENLIQKIKKRTYDLKLINLWENNERTRSQTSHFNTQFLLYYFLNSGSKELNIEILRIMKLHFPVPLAINTWSNRFAIEGVKVLNDLFWVIQKGFVITSFGFGEAENEVCGKTELNNRLLYSNFVLSHDRNTICQGCPEIQFDIYKNDKFPINLIDIPRGTKKEIKEKIISASNMLMIHSSKDEKEIHKYLEKQAYGVPIIVLYRDSSNAFSNSSRFRENLEKSYKKALETNIFEIKVGKVTNYTRHELQDISEKVNEFVLQTFQSLDDEQKLWKFLEFYEGYNPAIHATFDKIRLNSSTVIQAIPIFAELKKIEQKNIDSNKKEAEAKKLLDEFRTKTLSNEMNEILAILNSSENPPQNKYGEKPTLVLEKLQEYLRMMKSQQTIDFYKLYEFKSKLSECGPDMEQNIIENFYKYWNEVGTKENFFKEEKQAQYTKKEEVLDFVEKCIEIFEQKIIPNIFSIELFWRELIYFNSLKVDCKITLPENSKEISTKNKSKLTIGLEDFIVSLRKGNLLNSYPFEIIDGDLLYMAKDFYKTIFKGMTDHVVVISVLGPQSSGKSTLLNFLFGCNFVTSSGRCTKGVYGTYFKVSNFNSCDGILVLDTEGLFGLLNKSEEQHREKFDKKLVLFCLAMSDFVFINFKGDIDKTLTETLMVCKDSLKRLEQGNAHIPEMFLILNQNTQTNIKTQLQDINKMSDMGFSQANVEVLPLAFETSSNESPAIAKYMDPVMKKIPKKDFSDKCCILTQKLFAKIDQNVDCKKQRTLETIVDRMEHLWESLDKFPDLLKYDRLQDRTRESEIKDWIIKEVDGVFSTEVSKIVDVIKKSPKMFDWEEKFYEKFNEQSQIVKAEFLKRFQENTQDYLFKELETVLMAHIDRIRLQKISELKIRAQQEKIRIYDTQGNETIREAAYSVKKAGNMSHEEKENCFKEAWQLVLSHLGQLFDQTNESKNLFNIVVDNYKANVNKFNGTFPFLECPRNVNLNHNDYKKILKANLEKDYANNQAFDYTKQPSALIFKGGKTNIKFKHFDLRQYFEEISVEENIGIRRNKLDEVIDLNKIKNQFLSEESTAEKEKAVYNALVEKISGELKDCGIQLCPSILERTLRYKMAVFFRQWFSSYYVKPEEFTKNTCHIDLSNRVSRNNFEYIYVKGIIELKRDYYHNRKTLALAIKNLLSHEIDWDKILKIVKSQLDDLYQEIRATKIEKNLRDDLSKLNLCFENFHLIFSSLWKDFDKSKSQIGHLIDSDPKLLKKCSISTTLHDYIVSSSFDYIKKNILLENIQKIQSSDDQQNLILQKFRGVKRVVKKKYESINWLNDYAREETSKIFANTLENQALRQFVFAEFDFSSLIDNVFEICLANVKQVENWNSPQLYQNIVRQINDCLGIANNDLQQVSYKLDYKLVGSIHAAAVLLIWKVYEEKHWKKITQPLLDIESRMEQQKSFFDSIASSDMKQINSAEAEKVQQYLKDYISKNLILEKKKDLIISSSEKFRNEVRRKQIQETIDAKYFSRTATANNDDLYYYILNPDKVLSTTYEKIVKEYVDDMKNKVEAINLDSNKILQELVQKITSIQVLLSTYPEETWDLDNIFEFKKYNHFEKDEVGMSTYSSDLEGIYYRILLNIVKGTPEKISSEYNIDDQTTVILKTIDTLQIPSIEDEMTPEIIQYLETQSGKVTNAKLFMDSLVEKIKKLIGESKKLFSFTEEDEKEFSDQINIFICQAKCPCCDRICGEEDPHHHVHQSLYGHQIRAIGGTMLDNGEASISRCEDIEDFDKMCFNGQEMSWAEFKDKMRNQPNNPWSFDDLIQTRTDEPLRERFNFAWTLIGERICQEKPGSSKMKYIAYNQATIASQKAKASKPTSYIFMIDTSGSMQGSPWEDLKISLKQTLGSIHSLNKKNKVTIVNFSSYVQIDYQDTPPNSVNVDVLRFQNGGTDFFAAFAAAFRQMKTITSNDIVLIFMTDGGAGYPTSEINTIKDYINSSIFKSFNISFDFYALGFPCNTNMLTNMANDLDGETYFAQDRAQLTNTFFEILNKEQ